MCSYNAGKTKTQYALTVLMLHTFVVDQGDFLSSIIRKSAGYTVASSGMGKE
jgi:hypothetical protein